MQRQYIKDLLAFLAGGILPLAFSPFHLFPFAVLSIFFLLLTWSNASRRFAFWRGWLFGMGMFGVGVSWVYISIHRYGNTSVLLSSLLTLVFIVILALFPAINGYMLQRFFPKDTYLKFAIAFPASWVIFEWLRGWLFTGFPWLYLGVSQTNSPLRGWAPLIGEFGISFCVVLTASLLWIVIKQKTIWRYLNLLLLINIWLLASFLINIQWTKPAGSPIIVSLVQGDIPQEVKWNPNQIYPTLLRYQQLTDKAWGSQIIIWPEAAITLPLPYAQIYVNQLSDNARIHHVALITGIPIQINGEQFYNSVIGLGEAQGQYNKRHLVPFGEYVPLESLLRGVINFFNLPMSEFIPGNKHQQLLHVDDIWIAPYICYEVAYADLVRTDLPQAQLLMTVSNDSWFGDSIAAWQHLQIAKMRSLETGRYMLFTTNNGVTAIITPQGVVQQFLPRFQAATLTGQVYAMNGATPWVNMGNTPIICILFLLLLLVYVRQRN